MPTIRPVLMVLSAAFAVGCSGGDEPTEPVDPDTEELDTEAPEPDTEAPVPVDCVVSAWSAWSECSEQCDGGLTERTRTITQSAQNGGSCPNLTESEACNEQACTTPQTVRIVDYADGAFAKITSDVWMHNTTADRVPMDEFNTDATTVFLSDGVFTNYYLNLDSDDIRTSQATSTTTSAFADITSAEGLRINGYSATRAPYNTGEFIQLESGQWVEHNNDGIHRFNEIARDIWSVYLRRTDGNLNLRIDWFTMEIYFTPTGGTETFLVTLFDPNTTVPNALSTREVLHSRGSFTQTGWTAWVEDAPDGEHLFQETGRDADSIWLDDVSRDVTVQLDIASGDINVGEPGNNRFLYAISETW